MKNTLYYGDNLDILRGYISSESVDLVYLDPPIKQVNLTYKKAPRQKKEGPRQPGLLGE